MDRLLGEKLLISPSSVPLPDDHDVLSFLTFSLREPGPEVIPVLPAWKRSLRDAALLGCLPLTTGYPLT